MNGTFKKEFKNEYGGGLLFLLGLFITLILFSPSVIAAVKWFFAVIILLMIPGFSILLYLWDELSFVEKIALSPFIGFGGTPFLMFVFSQLGVKAVSVWFALVVALVSAGAIIFHYLHHKNK